MKITEVPNIKAVCFADLVIGGVYCPDHNTSQYMLVADEGARAQNRIKLVVLKTGMVFNAADFSPETLFWPVKYKFEVY